MKIENKRHLLIKARKAKALSQDDLAKLMGLSTTTICRYENGERTPNFPTAKKLCKLLEIDLSVF